MANRLLLRAVTAGTGLIAAQAAYAAFRPSPELEEFDPSGRFGDESHPTLRMAVLGDSSVTAPGVSGPDEIWIRRIAIRLAEQRHVILRSLAMGGSKCRDLVAHQLEPAISFQPGLVFVAVGANDCIWGTPLPRFRRELDHLVGRLVETGALVIQTGVGDIGTVPRLHPPLRNLMSRRSRRFDEVHWEVASRHGTPVVDQRCGALRPWFEDRSLWSTDLFHVSEAGHRIWAEKAWATLEQVLSP